MPLARYRARPSRSLSTYFVAVIMLLSPGSSTALGQAAKLKKPPDSVIATECAAARATYEKELVKAANDDAAAHALVTELMAKVGATPDSAGKWALLQLAQEVAERDITDLGVALKCADARVSLFEIDAIHSRLAVLRSFSEPKPPANLTLHQQAMQAAQDALAAGKYIEATEAAGIAAAVASAFVRTERDNYRKALLASKGQTRLPLGVAQKKYELPALMLNHLIDETRVLTEAYGPAKETLKTNPADRGAGVAVGEYECFVAGKWETGLPHLAAGVPNPVMEVAQAELMARSPPNTTQLLAVADRWWDLAKTHLKDSELRRGAIRAHAATIYTTVLPTLTRPVDVKRATDRIAEESTGPSVNGLSTAVIFLTDLQEDESKVIHRGFGKGTINGPGNPIRSIIDGKESPHGLSMHPGDGPSDQCFVRYTLPKGARRLAAIVTLDKGGTFEHCGIGFEVVADDRVVWKSKTINREHQSEVCEADIRDCRRLELRTYTVTAAWGGHAVWIEPRMTVDSRVWPASNIDYGTNRAAAEWALGINGKVEVEHPDKRREVIESPALIPAGPFVVTGLDLTGRAGVTDDGLAAIAYLSRLEGLAVGGTPITDESFKYIRTLPRLRRIGVNWTQMSGKGLATLVNAKLLNLDISGMGDPDAAVAYLHRQGVAEGVNFDGMKLSAANMQLLGQMPTLRDLYFRDGLVAPGDVEALRQKIPACTIHMWK